MIINLKIFYKNLKKNQLILILLFINKQWKNF